MAAKICVQGLWHLGCVTAASLASLGHKVVGFDRDKCVIDNLKQGIPPLFEPGLEDLLQKGMNSGNLNFSCFDGEAFSDIQVLWVAYDTPVDENDIADVDFVVEQIKESLNTLSSGAVILISSQLPVGSIATLEKYANDLFPNKNFSFACSPENLRLGKALEVFLNPDRIIVGYRTQCAKEILNTLLTSITDRIEWMGVESAEMTKHAINAFLALSITFANELASICEMAGADAKEVERGLKTEQRIGPKARVSPGGPFAGGTLARDIAFLSELGKTHRLDIQVIASVKESNDSHRFWVRRKISSLCSEISTSYIAVWGLTYKPGTDTLRRSAAVELIDYLLINGAKIKAHDPMVKKLPENWNGKVNLYPDPLSVIKGTDILVLCTPWDDYKNVHPDDVKIINPGLVVIDIDRFLPGWDTQGIKYITFGTPQNRTGGQ